MQITINIPDNLPQAAIQKKVHAFEEKLKQQAKEVIPATQRVKKKDTRPLCVSLKNVLACLHLTIAHPMKFR